MNSKQSIYKIKSYILNLPYYFRCFSSKTLDIIEKFLSNDYVKTAIVLLLVGFLSYQFSKRIAIGHLRTVIVFSLFFLLAAASISLKSGIMALIIYLPFMAFIRRYIYVYGRYVAMDPILIISDIITIFMFSYLVIFKGKDLYKFFRENKLVKFATVLLFIFILQMFNPRQGSILVGIGGAKFYIIPFLWFYFGLFIDKRFVRKLFFTIVVIGFITALYGLKQTFLGFTSFENYWIKYGGYSALHLFRIIRSFSTFASAGEYAHYLVMSGIICFAFFLKSKQKIITLVALIVILTALFISAVRSAIFAFVFSSIILIGFLVRDKRKGFLLVLVLCLFLIIFISKVGFVPGVDEYDSLSVTSHHALRGITNPMGEGSLKFRFYSWFYVFPKQMIKNPFGYGIGSISLAGWKFGGRLQAVENFILDIYLATGIIGGTIFLILLFILFKKSIGLISKTKELFLPLIVICLCFILFFLGAISEYSIGPIGWLLIGSVAKLIYDTQNRQNNPI